MSKRKLVKIVITIIYLFVCFPRLSMVGKIGVDDSAVVCVVTQRHPHAHRHYRLTTVTARIYTLCNVRGRYYFLIYFFFLVFRTKRATKTHTYGVVVVTFNRAHIVYIVRLIFLYNR